MNKKKASERMGFEKNRRLVMDFKNQRVTATIGGKTCNFRSKLEYRWALYLQWQVEQGLIKDWWYEQTTFRFTDEIAGALKYLIDFDIRNNDDSFYYQECKGYLSARDRSKFRKVAKYYPETIIDLVVMQPKAIPANNRRIVLKYCRRIIDASVIFRQLGIK